MKTIGSRIAAARERKGLNQSELGRLVGVTPQSVQAWESDKNVPRPKRLRAIASALDISVSALVDEGEVHWGASSRNDVISSDTSSTPYSKKDEILIQKYDLTTNAIRESAPKDYVELVSDITVCKQPLDGLGLRYSAPENLSVITAWDQSMESTISEKDLVLIDHGINQYVGDGIYLISWAGHLFLKRVQLAGSEQLELTADNPAHKGRVVPKDEVIFHAKSLLVWKATKL
ncbi:helix-turn-helix domain-containing protein [Pseudomonas sp. BN415]|uniref:XRE family transcriptional regulator n=1 Tax=Pseudomonas sp. BN415 TaxID=2567889 RepID=UPI002454EDC1|nr:helix-turn-helix domain-containing protein [Pseudomonas sp. BN415]